MAFLCQFSSSSSFSSVDVIGSGGGLVLCSLHGIPVEVFGAKGEEVAALLRSPTRARPREGEKRLLRSPRPMGGLTRGRVRPAYGVEGSRKRDRVAASGGTRLESNTGAGEIEFKKAC